MTITGSRPVGSLAACVFLLAASPGTRAAAQPPSTERLRLDVNRSTGLVTVKAEAVPISVILERLERAGIEVLVAEVEDRNVSLSLANQPLATLLGRLFPAGTRYSVRGGREEFVIPASKGDKPGRKVARPSNLPRKGTDATLPPLNASGGRKARPEVQEPDVKPAPEGSKAPPRTRELPAAVGPKLPKHQRVEGRYARLRLTMTSDGQLRVQEGLILEGEYVPDVGLLGEYVYALESGGQPLAIGSFPDPLVRHTHFPEPDRPHEMLTAKAGDFHVSLPGSVLDSRVLNGARLVIYRISGSPVPELTPQTFPKLRDALRQVHVVEGQELARQLSLATP